MSVAKKVFEGEVNAANYRSACDPCSASKVRCDGNTPCSRCSRKGLTCFYRPKKRRTAKGASSIQINNGINNASSNNLFTKQGKGDVDIACIAFGAGPGLTSGASMSSMSAGNDISGLPIGSSEITSGDEEDVLLCAHERKIWSVFFSLFKTAEKCSLLWFSHQLKKMQIFLEHNASEPTQARFKSWLEAAKLTLKDVQQDESNGKKLPSFPMHSVRFHFEGSGQASGMIQMPLVYGADSALGIRAEVESKTLPGLQIDENNKVTVNEKFVSTFGVDDEYLNGILEKVGGGFLPWGGDVMAKIFTRETDLMSFIKIISININALGPPQTTPVIREIPSVHVYNVTLANGTSVPCLVKCLHREIVGEFQSLSIFPPMSVQLFATFTLLSPPVVSHESTHLFAPKLQSTSGQSRSVVSTPSQNSMGNVVSPGLSSLSDQSVSNYTNSEAKDDNSGAVSVGASPLPQLPPVSIDDFANDDEKWLDELLNWTGSGTGQGMDIALQMNSTSGPKW